MVGRRTDAGMSRHLDDATARMQSQPDRSRRLVGLARSVALCESFDRAERDVRKARAAMLIAGFAIHRIRLRSQASPRVKS